MVGNKPHINDALVGNSRLLATFNEQGRLLRTFWPHVDGGQHIDVLDFAMFRGLTDCPHWIHELDIDEARYVEDTNILSWTGRLLGQSLQKTAFAWPQHDVLVQHLELVGVSESNEDKYTHIGVRADMKINEQSRYQSVRFESSHEAIVHYYRNVYIAIASDAPLCRYQCTGAGDEWIPNQLTGGTETLGSQSVMIWPITNEGLTIYTAFGHTLSEALGALEAAREAGYRGLQGAAEEASEALLRNARSWPDNLTETFRKQYGSDFAAAARNIYVRSLLVFSLLQDDTGAMVAAPEFDEDFARCGGYAYCWGRDAAYIVNALELCGMTDAARRFYEWAIRVQEPSGLWEHRHTMDGLLAPSWGIQLDETASLLWGLARHIQHTDDEAFAMMALPHMERAAVALAKRIDTSTGLLHASMDLWEERRAEHVYSSAAASAAFFEYAAALRKLKEDEGTARRFEALGANVQEAVNAAYSHQRQSFLRGRYLQVDEAALSGHRERGHAIIEQVDEYGVKRFLLDEDDVIDVSLLGLAVPFGVVDANNIRMRQTTDAVEATLTREVGGIGRYEGDTYIGGNPWILATLWLALIRLRQGAQDAALEQFAWAVRHRTEFSLLPEQVDRYTGETAWVVPLAWSHAMYVWFVLELAQA